MTRVFHHQPVTLLFMACLWGACATGTSRLSAADETGVPGITTSTGVTIWQAGILASIRPRIPSPNGLLKTAALGISLAPATSSPNGTLPEVYLFRKVVTSATELQEFTFQSSQGGTNPHVLAAVYFQMPETGEDWSVEQYALWFDGEQMDTVTDPVHLGVASGAAIESWSVVSQYDPGLGYTDTLRTGTHTTAGAFRFPGDKIGFFDNIDGQIVLRFAFAPPADGSPVDFTTVALSVWDPDAGQTVPVSARELHNRVDDPAGGLWIVVADLATFTPIGAILCFTSSQPDDCDRAPSGDALLYPLSTVLQ
jgi:hypothetical protein